MLGIDNVIALLVMTLAMMRRLEVISTLPEHNPHVSVDQFAAWRASALRAYNVTAIASALKVFVSFGWYYFFSTQAVVLQVGGGVIFIAWVIAVVATWRLSTEAGALRKRLGIERRKR